MVFENWKPRASAIGNILTNRPPDLRGSTPDDFLRLETLQTIRETGKNPETGRANKWDDAKQKEYDLLYCIVNQIKPIDELPKGAVTWLKKEFNRVYWGRKTILKNKYLEKGTLNEIDAIELLSEVDGVQYFKNEERLSNEYMDGVPDIRHEDIKDTKCSYTIDTFDSAVLDSDYEYQVKGYAWMDEKKGGEVCFCLVNTPLHLMENEMRWMTREYGFDYYLKDDLIDKKIELESSILEAQLNGDIETNKSFYKEELKELSTLKEWYDDLMQMERNMIFDPMRFKQDYPFYEFLNAESDLYIPSILRVKRFEVELTKSDIEFMKSRSTMAKKWLLEEEKQTIEKIKEFTNREIK